MQAEAEAPKEEESEDDEEPDTYTVEPEPAYEPEPEPDPTPAEPEVAVDTSIPAINLGVPIVIVGTKADYFNRGLNKAGTARDPSSFVAVSSSAPLGCPVGACLDHLDLRIS